MDFARMAFSQAWQVTALIVCVLLITRFVTRDRPHLAYMLWLVVLLKCVTPPLWSSPSGAFSWVQSSQARAAPDLAAQGAMSPVERTAIDIDFATPPFADDDETLIDIAGSDVPLEVTYFTVDQEDPERTAGSPPILVAIWAAGVVLALLVTGYRWLRCLWQLWRTPAVQAPALDALLSKLARQLKVRRRVRLLITSSRIGPAVIGLLRPVIVLPEIVVRDKPPEELEAILAHELIHVRRGDLWLGLLQVCAKAVWWFYPLVWWVNRWSTREAERCCDEEVIGELGCDPKRYARSLLEVLELRRTLQPVPAFPGMKPVEVTSKRLERIMKLGQGCHKRTPRWCWAIMLLLAAAALPGAAFIAADDEAGKLSDLSQGRELIAVEGEGGETLDYLVLDRDQEKFGLSSFLGAKGRQDQHPAAPLVVASYSAEDALPSIQEEFGCDESEALQTFGNFLIAEVHHAEHPISIEDRVRIWHDTIMVAASAEEHKRIAAVAERLRKYGVAQISIDIRFLEVPDRVVKRQITDWELTPIDLGSDATGRLHLLEPIDRPWPTDATQPLAKADATTTTNLPALYKIVDENGVQRLLETLQKDKRSNLLAAPKVTLFNGQSATVADAVQRPFVVAVTTVGDEVRAAQPHIRVVECGRIVRLRPLLRKTNKVWLDYDVKVSRIGDVFTTTVQAAGLDEPVSIQVPEVHTARIESAVEFELGKTVVIGGLTAERERGKRNQLLVLMTARRSHHRGSSAIEIEESATGQLMFGAGVVSDAGVVGQVTVDERSFFDKESYKVVPIMGPLTSGKTGALDEPSDDEVLRALDRTRGEDRTWAKKKDRFKVRIVKEKIADYVDPLRFIPSIGPAQLHHAHYKCTVHCSVWVQVEQPTPHKIEKEVSQVVYIDHNHFNLVEKLDADETRQSLNTRVSVKFADAPLGKVLKHIGQHAGFNIEIDADDIAAEGITPETPVTLHIETAIQARNALTLILEPIDLRYEVVGAMVVIRGKGSEPVYPAVYSVADLITVDLDSITPKNFQEGVYAAPHDRTFQILVAAIMQIAPDSWAAAGGRGVIEPFATNLSLVVSQTRGQHQEIAKFLDDLRKRLGLAAAGQPQAQPRPHQQKPERQQPKQLYTKIYKVADLVIPLPGNSGQAGKKATASGDSASGDSASDDSASDDSASDDSASDDSASDDSASDDSAQADFETLIDLITSTVAPDTWSEVGGPGKIHEYPANLSLVVTQASDVHGEVSELLQQLRRLQDLQVTVEAKFVQIPDDCFKKLGIDFDFADSKESIDLEELDSRGYAILSGIEASFLLQALQASKQAAIVAGPKVTTFNGQQAAVSFDGQGAGQGGSFRFQAVCSQDRRSVRLGFAVGADADLKKFPVHTVGAGETLLVRVTSDLTSAMLGIETPIQGVPLLGKLPYTSRLFKRQEPLPMERFVLLTPTIIVQEEEEEIPRKVILGGVTPHVGVEEEEEEKLKIEITP